MARIISNSLLFIHVAKTGGTFVREAFNYFGIPNYETGVFEVEDHYSISQVLEHHPGLRELHSFGFIRHPPEWYKSRWLWAMETNFRDKLMYVPEARKHWMAEVFANNLEQFLKNILDNGIPVATNYFKSMLSIGTDKQVNSIYLYENIGDTLFSLLSRFNSSIDSDVISKMPKYKSVGHKYKCDIRFDIYNEICKLDSEIVKEFY